MTAEITALFEPDRPRTADEAAAVAWWQNLSDEARLAALEATKTFTAWEAWEAHKRGAPAA